MNYMRAVVIAFILAVVCLSSAHSKDNIAESLLVTSSAFKDGEMIPKRYTGFGENISPAINWSKPPVGTKCVAILCEDPDAPLGVWTHWVIYNIPRKVQGLSEGVPSKEVLEDGTIQGMNDFKKIGYDGPHPPYGTHRYIFTVYALDTRVSAGSMINREELQKAMEGNTLATGSLMGRYSK